MSVRDKVSAFVRDTGMLQHVNRVLVGFSGGPDSTALLLLLTGIVDTIEAVHLHHGIRDKAADDDAAWCRTFCEVRNIPFATKRLDVPSNRQADESIEMAARRLRLEYWAKQAANDTSTVVALGHHLDDRLETFLQRFFRGSNATGLCGLRSIATVEGVRLVRPLLCVRHEDILEYLQATGVSDYRIDESNSDLVHERNRIRARLAPVLEEFDISGAFTSLDLLQIDAGYIEEAAAALNVDAIATAALRDIHPCLWPRLLRNWARLQYGCEISFRRTTIERLSNAIRDDVEKPHRIDVDGDLFLLLERGQLLLSPKANRNDLVKEWNWPAQPILDADALHLTSRIINAPDDLNNADPWCEYWDADVLGPELLLRPRMPGDRMTVLGSDAPTRIKKLLSGSTLGSEDKRRLSLVCQTDGTVIWLPGVRRSATALVTPETRRVVEFCCELR
jgi:tRNA(Ile)-lysidine synthase